MLVLHSEGVVGQTDDDDSLLLRGGQQHTSRRRWLPAVCMGQSYGRWCCVGDRGGCIGVPHFRTPIKMRLVPQIPTRAKTYGIGHTTMYRWTLLYFRSTYALWVVSEQTLVSRRKPNRRHYVIEKYEKRSNTGSPNEISFPKQSNSCQSPSTLSSSSPDVSLTSLDRFKAIRVAVNAANESSSLSAFGTTALSRLCSVLDRLDWLGLDSSAKSNKFGSIQLLLFRRS